MLRRVGASAVGMIGVARARHQPLRLLDSVAVIAVRKGGVVWLLRRWRELAPVYLLKGSG